MLSSFMKKLLFSCLLLGGVVYAQDLGLLLEGYKQESDFSKITRNDSASIVDIFTRDDLDKMQAHSLIDIMKSIPGVYLSRGSNNLSLSATPSSSTMPLTYARLYINDHDVSSSSLGSAFVIWGSLPIEYIDHIEVYKATSSLEFGNENAAFIIRLYTKKPEHDSGSKVALSADSLGSTSASFYNADILDNGVKYFAYGNVDAIKRTVYHEYNNQVYDFNSDTDGYNLFANINYKKWSVDIGSYKTRSDSFMGIGVRKTPTDGELDAIQSYLHVSKKFDNDLILQASYDRVEYERTYVDPNGIFISTGGASSVALINNYDITFHDDIASLSLEKRLQFGDNHLLAGGFYKYKAMHSIGEYTSMNTAVDIHNSERNVLNMYSLYLEDMYDWSEHTRLIASVKGDFFRYQKDVKPADEFLVRVGMIQSYEYVKYKLFYSKGYIPLAFYQQYNPDNTPYKANPELDAMGNEFYTTAVSYSKNKHNLSLELAYMRIFNLLAYDKDTDNGWLNTSETSWKTYIQLDYSYMFDVNNKIITNFIFGNNSSHKNYSPPYEVLLKSFNAYKKFEFYNELIYKSSYSNYGVYVGASFDFTSALKYYYTKDMSFGIRGENLFHDSYKQTYRNYPTAIPVNDQKVWLNMEYCF